MRLVRNRAHDISVHPLPQALATQQNNNSLGLSYGGLRGISVSYLLLVTITRLQCFLLDHPMGQVWVGEIEPMTFVAPHSNPPEPWGRGGGFKDQAVSHQA